MLIGATLSSYAQTFQTATVNDAVSPRILPAGATSYYLTFPIELPEVPCDPMNPIPGGCPDVPPAKVPLINGSITVEISNIVVFPGGAVIGGDAMEFDVKITNTSTDGSILTAFAFQSKFSESPALGSRIGDKLFYAQLVPDAHPPGPLVSVKKNGTSNGLFTGKWKGICINSSEDFIPEFNSGLEDESLECAGNRADTNFDGEPEILKGANIRGLYPGQSQTVRLRLDSGTTDGALHVVQPGTLTGTVKGIPILGPNGVTYFDVAMDVPGNVLEVVEFGDNKVLRKADGTFNPTFAPLDDGLSFSNRQYLTLPRRNVAFSDLLGRNHFCETYGLDDLTGIPCSSNPTAQPFITLDPLAVGDLVPGVANFAAILRGFGEFYDSDNDLVPDVNPMGETPTDARPNQPYDVLCVNCGGKPYIPVAEFYKPDPNDPVNSVIRQMTAGEFDPDPIANPYKITVSTDASDQDDFLEELIPEIDPGGPRPGTQLGTSATATFRDLQVVSGNGINGGDAILFTIDITNTSTNPDAYLTAFNYQTKRRSLADIGPLDGFTQDRRDIRLDPTLAPCLSLDDGACWNADLGIGQFPNVIGNGLLFGQMVWTNADAGREPDPVDSDQVFVDPSGIDPTPFWLESVKKNGPFSPILKGNTNFICVKSGLFSLDPDADAACAGQPAIVVDEDLPLVPSNITQRLGLPPGETQSVRMRMEFGDFRGALLRIAPGTLTLASVDPKYTSTEGLARFFDCSDQRELDYAHPFLVGETIGYLPNTIGNPDAATWLTPETLEEIEYVIINQPGSAPTIMNFQDNFGFILTMAGFVPSAEFYAPDPNPGLVGTVYEDALIRQQVIGEYGITTVNKSPIAAFTHVATNLNVDFDASTSNDPDGTIASYSWDFGDGSPAGSGVAPSHSYTIGGFYDVTLTVTDDDGATNSTTQTIGVFDPSINVPPLASFTLADKALDIDVDASASDDVDGTIVSYEWNFGDGSPAGSGVTASHTYATAGTYTVSLTVTDDDGAEHTVSQNVTVSLNGNMTQTGSNSNENGSQTVSWTSAFTKNSYVVGDYLVVRVEWNVDCGATSFNPNGHPIGVVPRGAGFSPSGVTGTTPDVLASGDNWVVFCFQFTNLPGVKGNAQFNILIGTDEDCDGNAESSGMLGVNVHVRTDAGDI
jgi:PKD repeat protein